MEANHLATRRVTVTFDVTCDRRIKDRDLKVAVRQKLDELATDFQGTTARFTMVDPDQHPDNPYVTYNGEVLD